jgi:L-aminopeptidase/D-esterase-like protein
MAHDGIARAVRPVHVMPDGDTVFTAVTGAKRADANVIGAYAADVVANVIVRGVEAAEGLGCLPTHSDIWGSA